MRSTNRALRRRPQWDWSAVFSVRAEDLIRPTPAFARHWLGFLASCIRPITIMIFTLTPLILWFEPASWFPDRHVVRLADGHELDVLEQTIEGDYLTLQYLSDVALSDWTAVRLRAQAIVDMYAGPTADEEACTKIELLPTEWCDNGLCPWRAATFLVERNDDGHWNVLH